MGGHVALYVMKIVDISQQIAEVSVCKAIQMKFAVYHHKCSVLHEGATFNFDFGVKFTQHCWLICQKGQAKEYEGG